ncbi:AAEL017274-PA [Aedes aegypti]|uniref:AAEL017274-PA n=1 Tax=Aedes aegypti TaxID=7159 RepID=J9HJF3_AEDAE|nr:AAEL017274-PA [Aedes aegypti]
MVPVGYTLPASRTHGYVNSHTAALTCLHVTVLCCVVCYKNCSKSCYAIVYLVFKSTLIIKIFHYNCF